MGNELVASFDAELVALRSERDAARADLRAILDRCTAVDASKARGWKFALTADEVRLLFRHAAEPSMGEEPGSFAAERDGAE